MSLTQFLSAADNEFASIADEGIVAGDIARFYDTGSYTVNALIGGSIYAGIPSGRATGIATESSVGKTMIALATLRQFLKDHPTGIGLIFESESALSKSLLIDLGIDVTRVAVFPVETIQQFQTQMLRVIESYSKTPEKERQPVFAILDSLGMLSTEKEIKEAMEGSGTKDMTRSQLVRSTFRTITLRMGKTEIPLFLTNHVYATMSMYSTPEPSGGGGFKYACSTVLTGTKAQDKVGDKIQGAIITLATYKSRLTREKMKIKTRILHDGGLDRYYGLTDLGVECGLLKKVSTKLEWTDTGQKFFESAINKEPRKHWTKERLERIEEHVKATFPYSAYEDAPEGDEDATDSN